MLDLTPRKEDLDPIEIASRDEIAALQLQRLKATLRRVYDNVPHYWKTFDAAGVHPDDLNIACRSRQVPVHHQGGPARELSVRTVRRAERGHRAHPRLLRHDRQADRGRLHQGRHRGVGRGGGALDPRLGRPARHEAAQRLRLRPVHRRARAALRRRAARHGGDPDLGRHDRAAGAAHHRLRARHHHHHAVLHAGGAGRVPPSGPRSRARPRSRPASSAPSPGPTPCAPRSSRPSTCTPSTSTASPR